MTSASSPGASTASTSPHSDNKTGHVSGMHNNSPEPAMAGYRAFLCPEYHQWRIHHASRLSKSRNPTPVGTPGARRSAQLVKQFLLRRADRLQLRLTFPHRQARHQWWWRTGDSVYHRVSLGHYNPSLLARASSYSRGCSRLRCSPCPGELGQQSEPSGQRRELHTAPGRPAQQSQAVTYRLQPGVATARSPRAAAATPALYRLLRRRRRHCSRKRGTRGAAILDCGAPGRRAAAQGRGSPAGGGTAPH